MSKIPNRHKTKEQQKVIIQRSSIKNYLSGGHEYNNIEQLKKQHKEDNFSKNIVLIIDPQNDFSDANNTKRNKPGSLAVSGSSSDYSKIINFIENNSIDEIHISLDTHNERHIGHPGFWDRINESGKRIPADNTDGLTILSIDPENVITGFHIIKKSTTQYVPRIYEKSSYDNLCVYVHNYLKFYDSPENKHNQLPWIWPNHCIEGTSGHRIAQELQCFLDKWKLSRKGNIVKYHIKGQNNLAEMYSIFSAEKPVSITESYVLRSYLYTGKGKHISLPTGCNDYKKTQQFINLETTFNSELMNQLLGDNNRVFICGEAKTHCVKSSIIDLMEHASKSSTPVSSGRIVLLANMTSPIQGVTDDVEKIVIEKGFSVFIPNQLHLNQKNK
jgi:nicotinamidase-related amidase